MIGLITILAWRKCSAFQAKSNICETLLITILAWRKCSAFLCSAFSWTLKLLCAKNKSVRLACFKHAASVRPEPGSNSNVKIFFGYRRFSTLWSSLNNLFKLTSCKSYLIRFFLFNFHGSCWQYWRQHGYSITITTVLSTVFIIFFYFLKLFLLSKRIDKSLKHKHRTCAFLQ